MKNRICLYTAPFPWTQSYCQIVDFAAECGLSAIEGFNNFEFETPDPEAAHRVRKYADGKGIRFACFSVYAELTGDDRAMQMEMLKRYAEIAAILGSPYLHHTIAPEHIAPQMELLGQQYVRGINAVREIYDYADKLGVKTIYEDQGYVFNGVEGFGRFLQEVDRDVGVVIDIGNIFQVDEQPEPFIEAYASRACHAHIKNVATSQQKRPGWLGTLQGNYFDCRRPDDGVIDLQRCVELLEQAGYRGHYGLEFSAGPGGETAMKAYINQAASWLD